MEDRLYEGRYIGSIEKMLSLISTTPTGKKTLDLHRYHLFENTSWLQKLLVALPKDLYELNLNGNADNTSPNWYGTFDLAESLSVLPENLVALDLSGNHLSSLRVFKLIKMLNVLPENLVTLSLNDNELYRISADNLVMIFKALPKHLVFLDIGNNNFSQFCVEDLIKIVQCLIEKHISPLNLSKDDLRPLTAASLAELLKNLPEKITSVNLSGYHLYRYTSQELAEILSALPPHVTSIDLSNNYLGYKSIDKLQEILAAIPATVKSVNLEKNHLFTKKTISERNELLQSLPGDMQDRQRFIMKNNGESDFARTLLPMVLLARQFRETGEGLPFDIIKIILSFLYEGPTARKTEQIDQMITDRPEKERLQNAVVEAVDRYLNQNRIKRGANSFFNWCWNGYFEIEQDARSFRDKIIKTPTYEQVHNEINRFLSNQMTCRCYPTLLSFLREALNKKDEDESCDYLTLK
ncbi:Leucine-rich repeat protein [Legionella spiritensis]|nr:Leucine-rich repeat protein [Legionella spiritensis]